MYLTCLGACNLSQLSVEPPLKLSLVDSVPPVKAINSFICSLLIKIFRVFKICDDLPSEWPGGCLRGARGDLGGAGLDPEPPIGRHTHPCICSQTLRKRLILPKNYYDMHLLENIF